MSRRRLLRRDCARAAGLARIRLDVADGLRGLWSPGAIVLLQALWVGIFLYTGRSIATAARVSIYVVRDRI